MNILFIGVEDRLVLMPMLQDVIGQTVDFFLTDTIQQAPKLIAQYKINLFICDLKFPEKQVLQLIDALDSPHKRDVRGVFIHDEANYTLARKGINSYVMRDYILRPYDKERIAEVWGNCVEDKLYKYHAVIA